MGRKSKQAGGNMPLTHYERTQKYNATNTTYGTTVQRLAGHSQYQLGDCALTTQRLNTPSSSVEAAAVAAADGHENEDDTVSYSVALCSPSGYLYAEAAIVEYLLNQTLECKRQQQDLDDQQQHEKEMQESRQESNRLKRVADFQASQSVVKKSSTSLPTTEPTNELNRVSYWLASAQPIAQKDSSATKRIPNSNNTSSSSTALVVVNSHDSIVAKADTEETIIPTQQQVSFRPVSPMTGSAPLRRKDLWPIQLEWEQQSKIRCAVSKKSVGTGAAVVAYWTKIPKRTSTSASSSGTSAHYGRLVLQAVYDELDLASSRRCPLTDKPIHATRTLQKSGSSFAASGQAVEATLYRPTIT